MLRLLTKLRFISSEDSLQSVKNAEILYITDEMFQSLIYIEDILELINTFMFVMDEPDIIFRENLNLKSYHFILSANASLDEPGSKL